MVNSLRNSGKPFSIKAVNLLYSKAGVLSAAVIAKRLGRTEKSIRRKAERIGLSLALN